MKRKKKETMTEALDRAAQTELTAQIQSMTKAELRESMLRGYSQLQHLWLMQLHARRPCWPLLEQLSAEMKIMEETLEPLLRCL